MHPWATVKTKCKLRPEFIWQISHYFRFLWNSQFNLKKINRTLYLTTAIPWMFNSIYLFPWPPSKKRLSPCSGSCPLNKKNPSLLSSCILISKFNFKLIYCFVGPNTFHLLHTFEKHDALTSEADYYCLEELKDLLDMEVKKNAMWITFCTQHAPTTKVLFLSRDTLLLHDLYMNAEEKEAFLSDTLTIPQVIRMKLQLQQDGFSCFTSSIKYSSETGMGEIAVVLEEIFKRR